MNPPRPALVALLLALTAAAHAGPRWFDTYAEAQKTAQEFGRPMAFVYISEKSQVRSVQRMFDKPALRRFHSYFVFTYEQVQVKDNMISSPMFRRYPVTGMTLSMPLVLIFFAAPDEKVLYKMAGEQTAKALASGMMLALRKHGPVPDLKDLREAKTALTHVDALLEKEDYRTAARLIVPVTRAKLTPKMLEEAKKRLAKIDDAVGKKLDEALRFLQAKNYPLAVAELDRVAKDYPSLEAGKRAAGELDKLRKLPQAKAAFDALGKAPPPGSKTAPGKPPASVEAAGVKRPKPEEDPNAFTDEELDALDKITQGGFDDEPVQRRAENPKAQRLLRFARNWIANRQPAKARQHLNQILDLYPDSLSAEQAKALLKDLD